MTVLQSTGLSPYFMVHSIEPLFPFDLAKATFLIPPPNTKPLSSSRLITWRAQQLQKRQEDLESIRECVQKARFESVKHFVLKFYYVWPDLLHLYYISHAVSHIYFIRSLLYQHIPYMVIVLDSWCHYSSILLMTSSDTIIVSYCTMITP